MIKLSIVTPVYKAEACLTALYQRLKTTLEKISPSFEIIMVNDASPDKSWEIIKTLAKKDKRLKGLNFSRNFGQHYAITAGLEQAQGEWVVVMDCDLQDQPEEISKLYAKAGQGYAVVFARRIKRQDNFLKKFFSSCFYKIFSYFTDSNYDNTIANFSISKKIVIESYRQLQERHRLFPLAIKWLGFKTGFVDVEHSKRFAGHSAYTFKKLFALAFDTIIAQSNKPLKMFIKFGFGLAILALAMMITFIARYFIYKIPVQGWTSIMVSLYFIAGLLFANLGLIGIYLGQIFAETKKRPLYIIQDKLNF